MAKARGLCLEDGCNRESEPTQTSRGHPNFTNGGNIADSVSTIGSTHYPAAQQLCVQILPLLRAWSIGKELLILSHAGGVLQVWTKRPYGQRVLGLGKHQQGCSIPSSREHPSPVHTECSHNRMHTYTCTTSLCHTSCIHYWNCWSTSDNDFARLGCFLFSAVQ